MDTPALLAATFLMTQTTVALAAVGDIIDFDFSGPIANGTVLLGTDGETTATFSFESFGGAPALDVGTSGFNRTGIFFDTDQPGHIQRLTVDFSNPINFGSGIEFNDWQVYDIAVQTSGANATVTAETNSFKYDVFGSGTSTVTSNVTQAGVIDFNTAYSAIYTFDGSISSFSVQSSDTSFSHEFGTSRDQLGFSWTEASATIAVPEPSSILLSAMAALMGLSRRTRR